jgi:hypothetical protein
LEQAIDEGLARADRYTRVTLPVARS